MRPFEAQARTVPLRFRSGVRRAKCAQRRRFSLLRCLLGVVYRTLLIPWTLCPCSILPTSPSWAPSPELREWLYSTCETRAPCVAASTAIISEEGNQVLADGKLRKQRRQSTTCRFYLQAIRRYTVMRTGRGAALEQAGFAKPQSQRSKPEPICEKLSFSFAPMNVSMKISTIAINRRTSAYSTRPWPLPRGWGETSISASTICSSEPLHSTSTFRPKSRTFCHLLLPTQPTRDGVA